MANKCKVGQKRIRKNVCARPGSLRANTGFNRADLTFLWVLVLEALFLSSFGLFNFNPVDFFNMAPFIASVFYLLFWIAPIYLLIRIFMKFR